MREQNGSNFLPPPDRGPVPWICWDLITGMHSSYCVVSLPPLSVCNDLYRESALESESRLKTPLRRIGFVNYVLCGLSYEDECQIYTFCPSTTSLEDSKPPQEPREALYLLHITRLQDAKCAPAQQVVRVAS